MSQKPEGCKGAHIDSEQVCSLLTPIGWRAMNGPNKGAITPATNAERALHNQQNFPAPIPR